MKYFGKHISCSNDIIDILDIGGILVRLVYSLLELYASTRSRYYGYVLRIQEW